MCRGRGGGAYTQILQVFLWLMLLYVAFVLLLTLFSQFLFSNLLRAIL